MATPFLEPAARPLLVLHGLLGAAVVGAQTHHAVWALRSWVRRPALAAQARVFAAAALVLTAAQVALGAALYPTYRIDVRGAVFETVLAPGGLVYGKMIKLFDLKEHAAAACLAATALAFVVRRARASESPYRDEAVVLHRTIALAACALAWFAAVAGLWVTSARGLGVAGVGP